MRPAEKIKKLPVKFQLREFEKSLRKTGFSRKEAAIIAGHGYRKLLSLKNA